MDKKTFVVDDIYLFFVTAFGAAPGAVYVSQLADAAAANFSTLDFIKVFTTKTEFTQVYPQQDSAGVFADKFIRSVVKDSVGEEAIQIAKQQVVDALSVGLDKAEVIFNVINNLNSKINDPASLFFPVAQLFKNQVAVAKHYSSPTAEGGLGRGGTDLTELRAALSMVAASSDVSSSDKMTALIDAGRNASGPTPPPDDFGSGPSTLGRLSVGGQVQGSIETAGDEDGFAISLTSGTTYLFDLSTRRSGGGTLGDGASSEGALFLFDSNGLNLGLAINGGPNGDPRLSFTPTTSGTYFLKAAGADQTDLGTYTLKAAVSGTQDDFTSTSRKVEIIGSPESVGEAY